MSKKVLLTGAGGFVGSHVLDYLLAKTTWEFICPWRKSPVRSDPRVTSFQCDLTEWRGWVGKAGTPDIILNVASDAQIAPAVMQPAFHIINNIRLMTQLLDGARGWEVERVLHLSTNEVYGPRDYPGSATSSAAPGGPHKPKNPYAASKAAQEDICAAFRESYDVPVTITNTQNIFGERQPATKLIPRIINSCLTGEPVDLVEAQRSWLHADNVADAWLYMIENNLGDAKYHITGAEKEYTHLELADLIGEIVGTPPTGTEWGIDGGEIRVEPYTGMDGHRLNTLGWERIEPFRKSLELTVEWYLAHREALAIAA